MLQSLFSLCDGLARFGAAACGNAIIPSLIAVAVAYLVMRVKGWNSASRHWAWWLTLLFVVALPIAITLFRSPAKVSGATSVPMRHIPSRDMRSTPISALPRTELYAMPTQGSRRRRDSCPRGPAFSSSLIAV